VEIGGVSPNHFSGSIKQATTQSSDELSGLGEGAFIKLLLAQLQNQDPLKPMEDKEFIAQLAQFNSLNQLTQMNKTLEELMTAQALGQGSALIGKTVNGLSSDGSTIAGTVSGLYLMGGKVILDVNGSSMPLDFLHSVTDETSGGDTDGQNQSFTTQSSTYSG
jgi:flagellar basal-body rod modification protein FlgD